MCAELAGICWNCWKLVGDLLGIVGICGGICWRFVGSQKDQWTEVERMLVERMLNYAKNSSKHGSVKNVVERTGKNGAQQIPDKSQQIPPQTPNKS